MPTTTHLVVASLAAGTVAIAGAGAAIATTSSSAHTLSFTSKGTSKTTHFGSQFINTDKDVTAGHTVGDDVVSGIVNPKAHTISGSLTIALKGGQIYTTFVGNISSGALAGKVTGGAGKFKGIAGTISGTAVGGSANDEHLVVTYH